jgi:hypothetical protein
MTPPHPIIGQTGLKLDLGCGPYKRIGFIGVDRYPQPSVDVVCDFEGPLPFTDNSVGYMHACHSLEHIKDLQGFMQELYRIGQDRAIITIVAPYHNTYLNLANPYHCQVFNEHTARFWTTQHDSTITLPSSHTVPQVQGWGQAGSDRSEVDIDLRLLRLEYFDFPRFVGLPTQELEYCRQHWSNVTDQMMIHLLVAKTPITPDEERQYASAIESQSTLGCVVYEEPDFITLRRVQDATLAKSREGLPPTWHLSPVQQQLFHSSCVDPVSQTNLLHS